MAKTETVFTPGGWADLSIGVDVAQNGSSDFSAVTLVGTTDTLRNIALAMLAGARAIEKSPRYDGTCYTLDPFGEHGAPMEISYIKAAEMLRANAGRILGHFKEG